jgi:hypothetical protein
MEAINDQVQRGGGSQFVKNLCIDVRDAILRGDDLYTIFYYLTDRINELLHNQVAPSELIISNLIAETILSMRLSETGHPVPANMSFIVIKRDSNLLVDRLLLIDDYVDQPLDYNFYIKQLSPIDEMIKLSFSDMVPTEISFQKSKRHQIRYINEPIQLLLGVYEARRSVEALLLPSIKEPEPE